MIKAEALLRTGKTDEAAVIVTHVRKRAFKATPAKATVTGADLAKGYNYGIQAVDGTITEVQVEVMLNSDVSLMNWDGNLLRKRTVVRT